MKDHLKQVDVSNEEVANYYQQQSANFQKPEQQKVNYLIFDPTLLASQFSETEEQLQAEYQRYLDNLQSQQSNYSAAHILLTYSNVQEKKAAIQRLEEAKQKIQAGTDFAKLASELSEDISTAQQGGKLGRMHPGSLNTNFERALFSLQNSGDISEVVETEFGLHLIQLTAKEEVELPTFASLRQELNDRVVAQPIRNATSEKLEQLRNLSFSSDNISQVAEATELQVLTSDWLLREQLTGIWAEPKISKAVFADDLVKEGWLTEPLSLADGRYLVVARETYQPQQQQALEDVKQQVTAELKQQKATELVRKTAQNHLEKLQAKEKVAGNWQTANQVGRNEVTILRDINQAAFRLSSKNPISTLRLVNGDSVLLELNKVVDGEVSSNSTEIAQLSRALQEDLSYRMQNKFIQQLERKAKITLR